MAGQRHAQRLVVVLMLPLDESCTVDAKNTAAATGDLTASGSTVQHEPRDTSCSPTVRTSDVLLAHSVLANDLHQVGLLRGRSASGGVGVRHSDLLTHLGKQLAQLALI